MFRLSANVHPTCVHKHTHIFLHLWRSLNSWQGQRIPLFPVSLCTHFGGGGDTELRTKPPALPSRSCMFAERVEKMSNICPRTLNNVKLFRKLPWHCFFIRYTCFQHYCSLCETNKLLIWKSLEVRKVKLHTVATWNDFSSQTYAAGGNRVESTLYCPTPLSQCFCSSIHPKPHQRLS